MRFNKYGVSPKSQRTMDGIVFDSKKEMAYYQELLLRKKAKDIDGFERQVPFIYWNKQNTKKLFTYNADFIVYYKDKPEEVIDVKGFRTALFILKKKLIEDRFDIKILEV